MVGTERQLAWDSQSAVLLEHWSGSELHPSCDVTPGSEKMPGERLVAGEG